VTTPLLSRSLTGGGGDRVRAAGDLEADQFPDAPAHLQLLIHQRFEVFVEDLFFLVGQRFEFLEGRPGAALR